MEKVGRMIITFWCNHCRKDWKLLALKGFKNSFLGDVWNAKCPDCGENMLRPINMPQIDPYFRRSRKVKADIKKYSKDLIQMGDPLFDIMFPQHKQEREEKAEKLERDEWAKKST